MSGMFSNARAFNADISSWDISANTKMNLMFESAKSFQAKLDKWNLHKSANIRDMFANTNYPIEYVASWYEKVGEKMFASAFRGNVYGHLLCVKR